MIRYNIGFSLKEAKWAIPLALMTMGCYDYIHEWTTYRALISCLAATAMAVILNRVSGKTGRIAKIAVCSAILGSFWGIAIVEPISQAENVLLISALLSGFIVVLFLDSDLRFVKSFITSGIVIGVTTFIVIFLEMLLHVGLLIGGVLLLSIMLLTIAEVSVNERWDEFMAGYIVAVIVGGACVIATLKMLGVDVQWQIASCQSLDFAMMAVLAMFVLRFIPRNFYKELEIN